MPEELRSSTLYQCGPGLMSVFGHSVRSTADADGLMCSLAFTETGKAFFRCVVVV